MHEKWYNACESELCVKCVCLTHNAWELRALVLQCGTVQEMNLVQIAKFYQPAPCASALELQKLSVQQQRGTHDCSLVPRPFVGETAWQLIRVQTVYGYDVKEITAPPVQAMNMICMWYLIVTTWLFVMYTSALLLPARLVEGLYWTVAVLSSSADALLVGILLCTDIAHEEKITGLPQICILTLSLLTLTSPNFCIQAYTREYAAHQEN